MALTTVKSDQIQTSVALAGSPTTTTQSASDNSTKIATTAYVETAVANLVDSAPASLNTLDELAAALNDDSSFSTTVTNSIATKLPLAGGTLTGNLVLGDSVKAIFGAGSDLQIYHSGTNSVIDNNTGGLYIRNNVASDVGGDIFIQAKSGENSATFTHDGAVTLMYDNATKIATTSSGVNVTGSVVATGLTVNTSDQLIVNHSADGGGIRIDGTNNTNTGSLRFGDTSDNYIGAVEYNHSTNVLSLYADNATRMSVSSTGIDVTGSVTADGLNVEIAALTQHRQ